MSKWDHDKVKGGLVWLLFTLYIASFSKKYEIYTTCLVADVLRFYLIKRYT